MVPTGCHRKPSDHCAKNHVNTSPSCRAVASTGPRRNNAAFGGSCSSFLDNRIVPIEGMSPTSSVALPYTCSRSTMNSRFIRQRFHFSTSARNACSLASSFCVLPPAALVTAVPLCRADAAPPTRASVLAGYLQTAVRQRRFHRATHQVVLSFRHADRTLSDRIRRLLTAIKLQFFYRIGLPHAFNINANRLFAVLSNFTSQLESARCLPRRS
jgi:hypothetical protein